MPANGRENIIVRKLIATVGAARLNQCIRRKMEFYVARLLSISLGDPSAKMTGNPKWRWNGAHFLGACNLTHRAIKISESKTSAKSSAMIMAIS
jgi:hypothetical protein